MANDLKSLVATIAPTIATMLGGPFAGTAVTALETAFGLQSGAGPDAIVQAVQAGNMTPEVIAAMRAADQKHAEAMAQQGIDLEKMNLAHQELLAATDANDRNSARQREMAVKDWAPILLAAGTTVGFFGVLISLLFIEPPPGSKEVLFTMLGALSGAWVSGHWSSLIRFVTC